jgi:hypothetical protein
LRDLILEQARIKKNISKKLVFNDKVLENINTKMDSFSSTMKDQLSYNKKIESQLAQLVVVLPIATNLEKVNAITTRSGKSTRDPPYSIRTPVVVQEEEKKDDEVEEVEPQAQEMMQDFHDTTFLLFSYRNRKAKMDEQFVKFVEVIQKLYINILLIDDIQVPIYAKYLRDKRPLPFTEVIKLTEECSAAILNTSPVKKKDPGCPTIDCSIRSQNFENTLCDLGASVSVMPKKVFDKLNYSTLIAMSMCLQLANQLVHYPAGIAKNILVKIRNLFVPVDFVVLDMQEDMKTHLILERPFLSTMNAYIDVGAREIKFYINGKEEQFAFKTRPEQCSNLECLEKQVSRSPSLGLKDTPEE